MTPEEQRVAIAEACGWTETEAWLDGRRCFERADSNAGWDFDSLPNYLNDLNAMHDAEKAMNNNDWWKFVEHLTNICGRGTALGISATASQRAEAFLRTIGKWEEAK
jgi:hypothetical protein